MSKAEEYKEDIKNNKDENINLKVDYLIKVNQNKGQYSFYEKELI